MNRVIESTYNFIDTLDNSEFIMNLKIAKEKVVSNKKLMDLINKCQNCDDNNTTIWYRSEIYKYKEYKEYMKLYNELSLIVFDINKRFKKIVY